jgi:hypothetical protein
MARWLGARLAYRASGARRRAPYPSRGAALPVAVPVGCQSGGAVGRSPGCLSRHEGRPAVVGRDRSCSPVQRGSSSPTCPRVGACARRADGAASRRGVSGKAAADADAEEHRLAAERERVLAGVFTVTDPERYRGQWVLLFDDICQSGTTLAAATRVLLEQGGWTRVYSGGEADTHSPALERCRDEGDG